MIHLESQNTKLFIHRFLISKWHILWWPSFYDESQPLRQCLDHTNCSFEEQEVLIFAYVTGNNELDWLQLLKSSTQWIVFLLKIEMCGPWEIPRDCRNTHALRRGQSNWTVRPTHKADIKHFCHIYKTGLPLDFFLTINHFQKDKFVSAPMIIIGSIPKSSNLYLLHWKIHME